MAIVYLGIGSNLGNRESMIQEAQNLIQEIPETRIEKKSNLREYEAMENAKGQPPFLNAVLLIQTELLPMELLHKMQVIERKMGRAAKGDSSQRPIDLDILSYDNVTFKGKNLIIPHPRMHGRIFVLEPLVELDANWMHPKLGKTAQMLLSELQPYENPQEPSGTEVRSTDSTP